VIPLIPPPTTKMVWFVACAFAIASSMIVIYFTKRKRLIFNAKNLLRQYPFSARGLVKNGH
jgi:hypothetical protein